MRLVIIHGNLLPRRRQVLMVLVCVCVLVAASLFRGSLSRERPLEAVTIETKESTNYVEPKDTEKAAANAGSLLETDGKETSTETKTTRSSELNKNSEPKGAAGSCLQTLFNATYPSLIRQLASNPEDYGVRTIRGVDNNKLIRGLTADFFRRRRMVLLGDSTLYYMTKWLDMLLLLPESTGDFSYKALSEANSVVISHPGNAKINAMVPRKIIHDDGTHIEWIGLAGPTTGPKLTTALRNMFQETKKLKPEIIVANMG
jgi:hypothetical protein